MKRTFPTLALRLVWCVAVAAATLAACSSAKITSRSPYTDWPHIPAAAEKDPAVEARALSILRSMTLRQKVGQITQAEIHSITPEEARTYYVGSVLNGGSSWPNRDKHAKLSDWLELADKYYQASVTSDAVTPVPIIWGTDAVHGHSIVYGATLFPHNIGLGATRDPELIGEIARAVARAVRASGIQWVFAPTLAVVRDDRWGRTYEGFAEDPFLVEDYAAHYVAGLQGHLGDDDSVLATAKHFIGDGGTHRGIDKGENRAPLHELINVHGRGYFGALRAGVQTVMASFSGWNDITAGKDYGKMHGNRYLLTDVLKRRLGFDGFLVSDWNAIGYLPGCSDASCPAAINAGIDMVMVPEDWRSFIDNTVRQVERGEIAMQRLDDAVLRILRVKLRAGLFERGPRANRNAGRSELLTPRALARRAVRESLVLLKNNGQVLPLSRTARVLVVGAGADSFAHQSGGWSLTWQGTDNTNGDFPVGETILAGLRAALTAGRVDYSADGNIADLQSYDAVIAVLAETPYAEKKGDIPPDQNVSFSRRYPQQAAMVAQLAGRGVPIVTVLLTGRPVYSNDLINRSNSFVVAWLPGTEGGGVADLLIASNKTGNHTDFTGTLAYSWPRHPCQEPVNSDDASQKPLFAPGYGLRYARPAKLGPLEEPDATGICTGQ